MTRYFLLLPVFVLLAGCTSIGSHAERPSADLSAVPENDIGYNLPEDNPYGVSSAESKAALADCTLNGVTDITCAANDYRDSNQALNAAVETVKKGLADDPNRLALFNKAQATWKEFRKADCDFDAAGGDGPDGQLLWLEEYYCRTGLTTKRTEQLNAFAACLHGSDCESPKYFYTNP